MAFQHQAHVRCRKLIQRQKGRRVLVLCVMYFLTVYVGLKQNYKKNKFHQQNKNL